MRTIWKYPLNLMAGNPVLTVTSSKNAAPRMVGMQGDQPTLWMEVEPDAPSDYYHYFYIRGTGHEVPDFLNEHVGSFIQGPYVWHVYRLILTSVDGKPPTPPS